MAADNGLALQFCNSFSVADLQRRPTAVTAIPERNLLVVGSPGHLATYDAVNSVRHAQFVIPKNHTPRLLHVLPSKADVVIVCLEWTVYVQPLRPSKSAMVMDLSGVKKKPLADPLLTSMLGSSSSGRLPVLFVASAGKDSIRSAYLMPTTGDKGKVTKELQPGFKLPLDKGKGIVALASHPFAPVLTVLTVNGELQLYQHTQGAPTLTPIVQYTMLLEESKTPSPLVQGARLSEVACPRVPNTAMIFIFLPRLSLFYIMTHAAGATPVPFMRIPWLGCNQVLTVELSSSLNTLIAVAGNTADGKFRMRAWTILGDEGCSLEGLRLQPRNCSQNIDHLEASADAGVVSKTPDWAKLWSGNAALPAAATQGSLLDLTTVVYPDKPSTAAAVVPQRAFVMAASNLLMVRYVPRTIQTPGTNFCPVAAFRFVDMDHPTQHHPAALAGAIHTSPLEWQVQDIEGEAVLTLPHAVPFLNERAACLFAPAIQDARLVERLPPKDGTGQWLKPDHMAYSRVQHIAFVFCALVQDTSQRTFTHVDFAAQPTEDQVKTKLFFQGIMGTFLGPTDSAFLVLESRKIGADNFAVYTSSSELTEESLLGYTYVQLDTGDCAVTVWPGPPACQMLKEAQYDPIDGSLIEEELVLGLGLALVGTAQGSLLLVLVPDVSEADTDQDLEACQVQCEMQLLESERVVQVAWNTMVHRTQVGYASHCMGAILTSQRVVITDGALATLQSVAVAEPAAAVPHIITSLLWVGPALLMSHASGRVEHVMLSGKRRHVCSLARVGSYVLAGATADSLILLHNRGPAWLITSRKVLVASLIMQSWLCMLSEGHAYGTWPNVRRELQLIVKHFNVQPASDTALAEALLEAGCGDMLRRCSQFIDSAGVSKIAHAAASNDWQYATDQVIKEYETSAYSPSAPPETSQLRQALITISLGAMSQGKWHCAERCLAASGETLLLMLLHALQHNRAALQQALKRQGDTSPMSTLAMLLLAADARIGLRQPLQKDWQMSRPVQDTDASTWEFAEALVPRLKAQADRSVRNDVAVEPGEEGPIPPVHEGGLASHLGLTYAEIIQNATMTPSLAPTTALSRPLADAPESVSEEPKRPLTAEEIEQQRVRDQFLRQFSGDSMFMDSAELAQRNAGGADSGLISVAGDDDDEGEVGDLHARNMKRAMRRQKQATNVGLEELAAAQAEAEAKKAQALGPEGSVPMGMAKAAALEAAGKAPAKPADVWDELGLMRPEQSTDVDGGAEQAQEEDDDPFAAFGDMALPEPTPPEAPTEAAPSDNMPAMDAAAQNGHDAGAPALQEGSEATGGGRSRGRHTFQPEGAGAAPEAGAANPAGAVESSAPAPDTSSPQAQALLDVNAGQTPGFLMGVHFMFAGQWNQALQSFAQAYASCGGLERVQVGQYIAAVGILQGYSMVGDDEACRLSRYAAAMPLLLTDHASFLVHDTVSRNMRAGNYTWAARRLEEFIAVCQAKGQQSVAQGVAGMLQQARAMGAGNRTVATDENTSAFVERINAAEGGEQIYGICTTLRSGLM